MLIIDKEQSGFSHPGIRSSGARCYGKARSNSLLLTLLTWVSLYLTSLLCIVITRMLFKLLMIQSFVIALSILSLIVILRIITFSMAPSLSPLSPLLCNWRISSQNPTLFRASSFFLANSRCLSLPHCEFEGGVKACVRKYM
jgi:hypothetical protein